MQAFQQHQQQPSSSYFYPAPSSTASDSGQVKASSSCHHFPSSTSGSTCSFCTTPPEHTYSSSSSSGASSSTSPSGGFGLSPTAHTDLRLPPAHQLSTVPFPVSNNTLSAKRLLPYQSQQSFQQQQRHNHLPKSLSRSSISSDGSTLLFSPTQDTQQLHNYSPLTPPLTLPIEANYNSKPIPSIQQSLPSSSSQTQSAAPAFDTISTAKPSNKLPLLPDLLGVGVGVDTVNNGMAPTTTTSIPAVMQPGCISQLATYLAEMVVYLWFSPPLKRAPVFPRPTSAFARFCNDILTTTQVSQSVVVLALYFVSKLQAKHSIEPRPGSEYKLTIASLMLANKILDDHTYTNKTWSEVSGLPLDVLNGAEMEFLQGLEFDLHVSHTAYKAWYTMLQNGESSNIVKQSQPTRKKAKVINPIAPSAPTSPMHHTSSSSTAAAAAVGFDFTFGAIPSSASATLPGNPFALQVPASRHSINTWPTMAQLPLETAYMQPVLSQSTASTAAAGSSQGTSRKRRASDAALSPARSATSAPQAPQPALQVNTSNLPRNYPGAFNGIPSHLYTPIVSTPASAMSMVSSSSRATTPQGTHGSGMQRGYFVPQDFMPNDLTSSWSPTDDLGNRRPQDLTYYALAAGQQRGGYLTHQPLPAYPTYPVYHPGMMPMYPQAGRAFAPLPRNVSSSGSGRNSSMTPVMQQAGMPQRMSLSLSPVDMRHLYGQAHDGRIMYPQSTHFNSSMQQQPLYNMAMPPSHYYNTNEQRQPMNAYSASMQGMQQMQAQAQVPISSPLEPSLQSLALSSRAGSSPSVTPMPSRQQQPMPPPQPYYSSFANNGLPGVLSWPAQALAKYHNVVQPHQQPWPRDFA